MGGVVPFGGFEERYGDVNIGGRRLGADMGNVHIMGVGEFWDRHWRC